MKEGYFFDKFGNISSPARSVVSGLYIKIARVLPNGAAWSDYNSYCITG